MGPRRVDGIVGVGCGAAALAVYTWTLAPGLIDIRDTPAFQYMGRILGVPHQPGYPFYLLISWAFSHLPIGSLAYRMNLLSAVFGAGTVLLAYFILRRAGCRAAVAAGIGLAGGLGPVTWSQSLIAEVYSLESLLVAATLLALLRWHDARRAADFYASASLFGLAVAHHPNDLLLAPAVLAFVWLTDRRWLVDVRRAAAAVLLAAAAFLPYAYLVIRTRQHAAYVLEPAQGLMDVVRIVTGAGYRENVFPFSPWTVLTSRVPLAASLIAAELTLAGCVAAIAGLVSLARAHRPLGAFLALGMTGLLAFILNYDIPDIAVFFIPVYLLAWIAAGCGVEAALRGLASHAPRWEGAAAAACLLAPLWLLAANGHDVSLRGRSATMRWADAVFVQIRSPAIILQEDWVIDQVVRYKTLGEGLPPGRFVEGPAGLDLQMMDRWTRSPAAVYAFATKAGVLRVLGWPVDREVVRVAFDAFAESLPPGALVAIAAPGERSVSLRNGARGALRRLGLGGGLESSLYTAYAGVGVRGASSGGLESVDPHRAHIQVHGRERIGRTPAVAPADITVAATDTQASILVDGREIVRTTRGAAVAVWSPEGNLREVRVAQGESDLTIPMEQRPLYLVRGPRRCAGLPPGELVDITPLAGSGVVSLQFPAPGRIALVGDAGDLAAVRIVDAARGSRVSLSNTDTAGASEAVFASTGNSGLSAVLGSFGRVPNRISARWTGLLPGGDAGIVCAVETGGLLDVVDDRTVGMGMANDEQALLLGDGWSKAEASAGGPVRRTVGSRSVVLVPLPAGGAWSIRVAGSAGTVPSGNLPAVTLSVDGHPLGTQQLTPGWQTIGWPLTPSPTARTHELAITASSPVVIGSIRFSRE